MSDIETIGHELRAMSAGMDQAQHAAAAADARAQDVAARAAMTGLAGVAMGMGQVSQAIHEIRQRLGAIARGISEAAGPVSGAEKQPSPQETIALLSPASDQVTAVREGIYAAIGRVAETQQLVGAVLQGGQPGPLVSALDGIRQVLGEVAQRSDAARQHLAVAIAQARQLGESGN